MKLLLRLSGEHPSLPLAEASYLFRAHDPDVVLEPRGPRLMVIETKLDPDTGLELLQRLSMTTEASLVLRVFDDGKPGNELPDEIFYHIGGRSFLVRTRGMGPHGQQIEAKMGSSILRQAEERGIESSVSLSDPEVTILLTRLGSGYAISRLVQKQSRSVYESRARGLPFRRPVSIDPVIARAMVNLSGVVSGDSLLDLFCGTGVILCEAGTVGARALGIDFNQGMARGTATNLASLGLRGYGILRADAMRARDILTEKFDHVVTDPPYGRASATLADPVQLLWDLPGLVENILRPGGTLCFASPSTMDLSPRIEEAGLENEFFAYQRVHGSLGRHLYLARKPVSEE